MPSSSQYGKLYTTLLIKKLGEAGAITKVIDCGCGDGTYHRLLSPVLPNTVWTGIEVWQPYITDFALDGLYHRLIHSDLRNADFRSLAPAELIIFGDVLEHMSKVEAQMVVGRAMEIAPFVLISIPVVDYPQGEEHGNPHEIHVKDDWDHTEVMASFPGITAFFIHDHIGVYVLTSTGQAAVYVNALQAVLPQLLHQQLPQDRMAWGGWQVTNHL